MFGNYLRKRALIGVIGVVLLGVALLGYRIASNALPEAEMGRQAEAIRDVRQGSDSQNGAEKAQVPEQEAPGFVLKDGQGKEVSLVSLKGKPVILHFWASWCPPCLEEIHEWAEAAKRFEGKPVHWVAVSLDPKWEDAHKILPDSELAKNVISLLDAESRVSDAYGSYQFPETYFLDRDLKIKGKSVGPQDWAGPAAQKAIEMLMEK